MQVRLFENGEVTLESSRPQRPTSSDLAGLLRYTMLPAEGCLNFNQLQSHFASRAAHPDLPDRQIAKRQLEEEIDWLEAAAKQHGHPQLFRAAASLAQSFSTWFCHTSLGEDKRPPLERALRLFACQAEASPTDPTPLLEAASIRIGRPQVRDKVEAKRMLDCAAKSPYLNSEQRLLVGKLLQALESPEVRPVRKLKPLVPLPDRYDYSERFWPPDERTRGRALLREAKKTKDLKGMQKALEHLYRVAVIAECRAFVIRKFIDDAYFEGIKHLETKTCIAKLASFSYVEHGRIKPFDPDNPFLSQNDYKSFEEVWGPVTLTLDPATAMGLKELLRHSRS